MLLKNETKLNYIHANIGNYSSKEYVQNMLKRFNLCTEKDRSNFFVVYDILTETYHYNPAQL